MSFTHLNLHSHYTLLKALGSPKDYCKKAKELGFDAIALTDSNNMYGAVEFYKAAKDNGLKAILGIEINLSENSRFDHSPEIASSYGKITLLAQNNEGYQNLLKLTSLSYLEGLNQEPRIDFELLKEHSSGLIALSGDRFSLLAQAILQQNEERIKNLINKFTDIFGEKFYLEIQRHGLQDEEEIIKKSIQLNEKFKIEMVATHGVRYLKAQNKLAHDILVCIGEQTNISNQNRLQFVGDYSLKSASEMAELFADLPSAIDNSGKIAESCDVKLNFGQNLIPKFTTPNGESAEEYLRKLCLNGVEELYPLEKKQVALERMDFELSVIHKMGFDDYFLIVWDFVNFAKKNGIAVGPGRGSAAGALIAYALKITELDPLEHGLIFERFLNPDRVSMPDIDIDFADHRRHEVLEYTIKKYGRDCVSQVITYGTMAAKAAVRDVGRAMGYPYSEVDKIAKAVPNPVLGKHAPLQVSVKESSELAAFYENDPRAKALLDNAINLEGTVRQVGTHACAVIISQEPLVNYSPLQNSTDGGDGIVTQYAMKALEDIGLLKMDFLGLKNLTIMEETLKLIKETQNKTVNLSKLTLDDQKTFELLQKGDTTGIFQLESNGMRRYIRELKPTEFNDIIAMLSLYRPGPMEYIPVYIKGKHDPSSVEYQDPSFRNILSETYGVAVYQEQILQIARIFAGFSLGQADILRRAVGKKDPKLLVEQKEKFVSGAVSCGHTQEHATMIFEKVVEPFAGYGFNKSHAACYAMISYQTCYLKAHFPTEFMTALLTCDYGNTDKITIEIDDCQHLGIEVLPPSINRSSALFTVEKEHQIRYGLSAIKGIGQGQVDEIIKIRQEKGGFNTLEELASTLPPKFLNKKTIESLAFSGALDEFGDRNQIAENYDTISKYSKTHHQSKDIPEESSQNSLFDFSEEKSVDKQANLPPISLRPAKTLSHMEKLEKEKAYLGFYLSGHPLKGLKKYLKRRGQLIGELKPKQIGQLIRINGVITNLKTSITKGNLAMAYGTLEDPSGSLDIVFFPKVYDQIKFHINENMVLTVDGRMDDRRGRLQIVANEVSFVSLDKLLENAKSSGQYDPRETSTTQKVSFTSHPPKEKAEPKAEPEEQIPQKVIQDSSFQISEQSIIIYIPENFPKEKVEELKTYLSTLSGPLKVSIAFSKEGESKVYPTTLTLENNPVILQRIQILLGEK